MSPESPQPTNDNLIEVPAHFLSPEQQAHVDETLKPQESVVVDPVKQEQAQQAIIQNSEMLNAATKSVQEAYKAAEEAKNNPL